MRNNLLKETVIKRFESAFQSEIDRHNLAIESYQKEIGILKTQVKALENRLDEKFVKTSQLSQEVCKKHDEEKERLKLFCESQHAIYLNHKKETQESLSKCKSLIEDRLTKKESQDIKIEILSVIRDLDRKFQPIFAHISEQFNGFRKEYIDLYIKAKNDLLAQDTSHRDDMQGLHVKVNTHAVDSQGLLRELQMFKKSIFIVEKKIENLYTWIERLKEGKA